MNKKKLTIYFLPTICFIAITAFFLRAKASHEAPVNGLCTYFHYEDAQIKTLKGLNSSLLMSEEHLKKWDDLTDFLIIQNKLPYYDGLRIYTYLYVAQREAVNLAYEIQDHFEGSLDPVSEKILMIFFENYKRPSSFQTDNDSQYLAEIIAAKLKARINQENSSRKSFKVPEEMAKNQETNYVLGNQVASWIPWVATPIEDYIPPPPPAPFAPEWKQELEQIKKAQKKVTVKQKKEIEFWAGRLGPGSGDWRVILNNYLFENEVSFPKMVTVRAALLMTLYDATIAYTTAKYHYCVVRPKVKDPTITYLIPMPNHPSYPSGHSTSSSAAAVILCHYFPEDCKQWKKDAEEAGLSRIRAGIHYPIDHRSGKKMGEEIACEVLDKLDCHNAARI